MKHAKNRHDQSSSPCDPGSAVRGGQSFISTERKAASNQRLIEAIGSPQKELKVIEGTGHLDLVTGLKFRETVQAVVDFIAPQKKYK